MEKTTTIYVNDNCGYSIFSNKNNISKEEIVENFRRSSEYKGCKSITKTSSELGIKYTAKFDTFKDYNVVIPTSNIDTNKEFIEQIDSLCEKMKLNKKQVKNIKRKKFLVGAGIILAGMFVLEKSGPFIENTIDKIIEWDNDNFEHEYEESGTKDAYEEYITNENYKDAVEQYNMDQIQQKQEEKYETEQLKQEINNYNQQQEQQMINDMEQYRDLDTMSNVVPIEEIEQYKTFK